MKKLRAGGSRGGLILNLVAGLHGWKRGKGEVSLKFAASAIVCLLIVFISPVLISIYTISNNTCPNNSHGALGYSGVPPPYYEIISRVTSVVDGDTINVWIENIVVELDPAGEVYEDTYETVRFGGGVDAPEWYMEGGSEATEFIEALIPVGTTVYLDLNDLSVGGQTGRPYRGVWERLIAVIYAEIDGQWVNINAELLRWGMEAYPDHDWLQYIYYPSEWDPYDWLEDDYPYVRDFVEPTSVMVLILPDENTGASGENVAFAVFVKNIGWAEDTYELTASDNAGWNLMLAENLIENISPDHVQALTLTVTIPENVENRTEDNIIVTATCQDNSEISGLDSCTARAIITATRGVEVSISPDEKEGAPDENVTFTVTVTNIGNVTDTYTLGASDNENWTLDLPSSSGSLAPSASTDVTLTVTIPEGVELGTGDEIIVTATSQENTEVSDNESCTVRALSRRVSVSISPGENSGAPSDTVTFTVTVTNIGDAVDNYDLTIGDNAGWSSTLEENIFESIAPDGSQTTTLIVTIPDNAENCTRDNVTVTATSQTNNMVSDNASCLAHAIVFRGVEVSISPSSRSGENGQDITFTITIKNTCNVSDTYTLENSDNAGWSLNISPTSHVVPKNENRTAALTVTIPAEAKNGATDSITVTVASQADNTIKNSASCIVHAIVGNVIIRGVEVSISPENQAGLPGENLTFTITVKNAGEVDDTYALTVGDHADWEVWLDENTVTLLAGDNTVAILSVEIPSDAIENETMIIIITAASQADPTVENSTWCTAIAGKKVSSSRDLVPIAAGGAAAGGGIIIVALLKRGILHLPFLRQTPYMIGCQVPRNRAK